MPRPTKPSNRRLQTKAEVLAKALIVIASLTATRVYGATPLPNQSATTINNYNAPVVQQYVPPKPNRKNRRSPKKEANAKLAAAPVVCHNNNSGFITNNGGQVNIGPVLGNTFVNSDLLHNQNGGKTSIAAIENNNILNDPCVPSKGIPPVAPSPPNITPDQSTGDCDSGGSLFALGPGFHKLIMDHNYIQNSNLVHVQAGQSIEIEASGNLIDNQPCDPGPSIADIKAAVFETERHLEFLHFRAAVFGGRVVLIIK